MALAAAQVVDALAGRLALVTATAGRVYTSRGWPLAEADLPCWRVVAADEAIELISLDGLEAHTLSVEATAYARVAADLDDSLHALASAGLTQVYGTTPPTYAVRTAGIARQITTDGEAEVGAITLRLEAIFHARQADPETIV